MKFRGFPFLWHFILVVQLVAAKLVSTSSPRLIRLRISQREASSQYRHNEFTVSTNETQGPFFFPQKLDHRGAVPGSPLFYQRYWVKNMHYRQGSPVFLVVSGETNAENILNMLDSNSMFNRMAMKNSGMLVVLEHRYFGESFPNIADLSEENLEYLTIGQVLNDLRRFASTGMNNGALSAGSLGNRGTVPWVLIGGGYSGGVVHWAMNKYPEIFWAGYASSAMVKAKDFFRAYWDSVANKMPKSCAKNVAAVVEYFDDVVADHGKAEIEEVVMKLRLSQFEHLDDIAEILSADIATWLKVDYLTPLPHNEKYRFEKFCNALERDEGGKDHRSRALRAWGRWNTETYGNMTSDQWSSHDPRRAEYTDIQLYSGQGQRVIKWLQCNELGWFKTRQHDRKGVKKIVSKQLTSNREWTICKNYFPKLKGKGGPDTDKTNFFYGGSSKIPRRVVYMIGGNDPNIGLTMEDKSEPVKRRGSVVVFVEEAHHLSDFASEVPDGPMNSFQLRAEGYIRVWVDNWYKQK